METDHESKLDTIVPLGELEDIVEPIPAPEDPEPIAPRTFVEAPSGRRFEVLGWEPPSRESRVYEAVCVDNGSKVALEEAWATDSRERVRRKAEIFRTVSLPMIPPMVEFWESQDRSWLATQYKCGRTLADELAQGSLPLVEALPVLCQVAHALAELHSNGWVHMALRPRAILLGKPVTLLCLDDALRVGEVPSKTYYYTGYSPPEILNHKPAHPKADIYALGAILYHIVSSSPIPESGVELTGWKPCQLVAGVPQIIHRSLGPEDSRYSSMRELHRDLVALSRRLSPRIQHHVGWCSSIGLEPSRTTNQDACGFILGGTAGEDEPVAWALICVSDGMGGMAAGEVASQVAVRTTLRAAAACLPGELPLSPERQADLVNIWAQQANKAVCDSLTGLGARGGATLLCALVVGSQLTIAHIGDCRLYLVRGSEATVLTRDHSLAMTHLLHGRIRPDELRSHPDRNRLSRCLGERDPLPTEHIDSLATLIGTRSLDLRPGDVLVACSDGIWEPLADEELATDVMLFRSNLNEAAHAIVRKALARGAPDNATVVLLAITQDSCEPSRQATLNRDQEGNDDSTRNQAAPAEPEG